MKKKILLFLLLSSPAMAGTTIPYEPGNNPCAGACSYEWALEASGAPKGVALPIVVPQGSVSRWMSYGDAQVDTQALQLLSDQPAIGYTFVQDGVPYVMAQLSACLNWTVMQLPTSFSGEMGVNPYLTSSVAPERPSEAPYRPFSDFSIYPYLETEMPVYGPSEGFSEPAPVSGVSLPASIQIIFLALLALAGWKGLGKFEQWFMQERGTNDNQNGWV